MWEWPETWLALYQHSEWHFKNKNKSC